MRFILKQKSVRGLTAKEILMVIGVLFVLAALLFPVGPPRRRRPAKIAQAKTEIQSVMAALLQYETMYSKMPFKTFSTNATSDFTFGTFGTSAAAVGITNADGHQVNNSELMVVLMDILKFENGKDTVNANHALNPLRTVLLNVRSAKDTNSPGLGPDGVFRDPWGNPYIISLNLKGDDKCRDAFYRLASVSETDLGQPGLHGLVRPKTPPYTNAEARDSFELAAKFMVWSLGPDGKADPTQKADQGVNKDNVLSW